MYKSISFQISLVNRILGAKYTKLQEVEEHEDVIEAFKSRNPDYAEKVMRDHIYRSYQRYVTYTELDKKSNQNTFQYSQLFPK